jgi:hypothetical protein
LALTPHSERGVENGIPTAGKGCKVFSVSATV